MYNGFRNIYSGTVVVKKYGKKAQAFIDACMEANDKGFYSIPVDSKYVTIGTSEGRYGEYAKHDDTFFSVNSIGNMWARVDSAKEDAFLNFMKDIKAEMVAINEARLNPKSEDEILEDIMNEFE